MIVYIYCICSIQKLEHLESMKMTVIMWWHWTYRNGILKFNQMYKCILILASAATSVISQGCRASTKREARINHAVTIAAHWQNADDQDQLSWIHFPAIASFRFYLFTICLWFVVCLIMQLAYTVHHWNLERVYCLMLEVTIKYVK